MDQLFLFVGSWITLIVVFPPHYLLVKRSNFLLYSFNSTKERIKKIFFFLFNSIFNLVHFYYFILYCLWTCFKNPFCLVLFTWEYGTKNEACLFLFLMGNIKIWKIKFILIIFFISFYWYFFWHFFNNIHVEIVIVRKEKVMWPCSHK